MTISGVPTLCLLDSGCEKTVLPARLVPHDQLTPSVQRLQAANETVIPVLGEVRLKVQVGSQWLNLTGVVSDRVTEPLIGID